MPQPNDLTTLSRAKDWLSIPTVNTVDDPKISMLISQVSAAILSYLNRSTLLSTDYTNESYDGPGTQRLTLRNYPVTKVAQLQVNNQILFPSIVPSNLIVPPSPSPPGTAFGWILSPLWDGNPPGNLQSLSLVGFRFERGRSNVYVSYTAGYRVTGEAGTVPAAAPFTLTPLAPLGLMVKDLGVTYAAGTALVPVAANPAQGQYVAPLPLAVQPTTAYTFAAADAGAQVLLSYSFVPSVVEQACLELVLERFDYRKRPSQRNKSLGGAETMGYDLSAIPKYLQLSLQSYRQVTPVYG